MDAEKYLTDRTDRSGGSDACHPWMLSVGSHGYGNAWNGTKVTTAHRLTWITLVGPIADGLTVDHLCYNRTCCNPRHLRLVTLAANSQGTRRHTLAFERPCKYGHPASERRMRTDGTASYCHECKRDQWVRYEARAKRGGRRPSL